MGLPLRLRMQSNLTVLFFGAGWHPSGSFIRKMLRNNPNNSCARWTCGHWAMHRANMSKVLNGVPSISFELPETPKERFAR